MPDTLNPEAVRARLRTFVLDNLRGRCRRLSVGDACVCALCDLERLEGLLAVPLERMVSRETPPDPPQRWDTPVQPPPRVRVAVDGVDLENVTAFDVEAGWARYLDHELHADGLQRVERIARGVVVITVEGPAT
ncbi:MAG: hypothetical protein OEW52_00330 [Thermoleophilia bacterium]|nr:hypothetical protein [Thermoleophilia bacterium]